MKIQRLTSDIINTLPKNIVENILTLMPIQDALKTSILSKKWRHRWKSMPKLAFDDNHVENGFFQENFESEGGNEFTFVELLPCVPLVRTLDLSRFYMMMYGRKLRVQQSSIDFHNLSSFDLDHLKELRILKFCNLLPEMEFLELIMAKSRVLEKARLALSAKLSADDELTMLRDLVRVPFPRASPTAKLIIERPKSLS
uniref:putative F-box/FBD/LRR-repeat protein At5g56810 n=1 Tax=Erigeron canadensis TaxID=72917 RepID=UPI001CB9A0B3|nr:putative F-box/FBD/LRR-repeat protein At5g56810 [Erigeron canadensis]